ncbi:cupin domain-containing protein [Zavarzinia sp. CC-PAN008]|uniref:cupin domain-containing protein n=1 Tax=Zavarzinia sp. CC-PAN008 TaxID=3243332 RepID=UPI003F7465CC
MSQFVRSIRFDANARPEAGNPTTTRTWYDDPTGAFSAGFWSSEPGRSSVAYTEDEFCMILEGEVRLSDASGHTETYKAGDGFIIPAGFKGTWETVQPVRKFFVIHQPRATAAA